MAVASVPVRPRSLAAGGDRAGVAEISGTDLLFLAYILLLLVEYLGVSQLFPPLAMSRLPTLTAWGLCVAMIAKVGGRAFHEFPLNRLLLGFVIFTALTVLYAVVQFQAFTAFRSHADYFTLFVATLYLLDRPKRIDRLVLVFSLIGGVMVARNLDKLTSAARQGAMAGAYFTGDGNDFGWLLTMILPLALYPVVAKRAKLLRLIGLASAAACAFGVMGTQSRGAALALGAATLYYWLYISKRKALAAVALILGIVGLVAFAPSHYLERLNTIGQYDEDESAQSRLLMWGVAGEMALDFPLGVGASNFSQAYGLYYLPAEGADLGWASRRWLSAHSVYFRVLGEYGILGLLLILAIIIVNYRTNHRTRALLREGAADGQLPEQWPALINMSLVGYAVAGTFLGGLTYPHLYIISALTASARRIAEAAPAATAARAGQAATDPRNLLERLLAGTPAPAATAARRLTAPHVQAR